MIDIQLECEKAAQQLNFDFVDEEVESNFPVGCYMKDEFVHYVHFINLKILQY